MDGPSTRSRRALSLQIQSPSRAKWSTSLTNTFVEILADQVHKGNKPNRSFSNTAWTSICEDFHRKTGLTWDKEQLKNKLSVLRKLYSTVKSLLAQGDFQWDEKTGVIMASDEAWDNYIKEHPDAENLRTTACPIYKHLCVVFAEPMMNSNKQNSTLIDVPLQVKVEQLTSESEDGTYIPDEQDQLRSASAFKDGSRKRGRKGIDDIIANAILEMAAASKLRTDAIMKQNSRFSIADCVSALDEMQDTDEKIYNAALDLFNNRSARETFLSLRTDKRLAWLLRKCSALAKS